MLGRFMYPHHHPVLQLTLEQPLPLWICVGALASLDRSSLLEKKGSGYPLQAPRAGLQALTQWFLLSKEFSSDSPLFPTSTASVALVKCLLCTHLSQVLPCLYLPSSFLATRLVLGTKQALYRHGVGTTCSRGPLSHCPDQWGPRKVVLS